MNEDLLSGYLAYTTADELMAPDTDIMQESIVASIIAASISAGTGASVYETIHHGC